MATWQDLATFIRQEYEVVREARSEIQVLVRSRSRTGGAERSQVVTVTRELLDRREEWVLLVTPFSRADEIDVTDALAEIGRITAVGGGAIVGEYLVLRHSVPLMNLDQNEFVDPLAMLVAAAEELEERFTGRDDY